MYHQDLDKVFKDVEKVFKEVDKVFMAVDKRMEEVMAGAAESEAMPWEKWFAWYPVTVKGNRQWMKTVYRRRKLKVGNYNLELEWEYGDMFDVIKEASK